MQFKDKVVWITGATSGFGAEMAKQFSQAGAKLILSARREDKLMAQAKELASAYVLPLDLADISSFQEKTQQAISAFGHIDIIMHNGALAQNASMLETNLDTERYLMDVDYFSYTELTRQILPHMLEREAGHIVVVSGLLAHINLPNRTTYAAAKAALIAYFGCLRAELIKTNINITVLIPGAMQTGFSHKAIDAEGAHHLGYEEEISTQGIPVDMAAQQALEAIIDKKMQIYIGLQDPSYQLWKMTLNEPEKGIQMLLNQLR